MLVDIQAEPRASIADNEVDRPARHAVAGQPDTLVSEDRARALEAVVVPVQRHVNMVLFQEILKRILEIRGDGRIAVERGVIGGINVDRAVPRKNNPRGAAAVNRGQSVGDEGVLRAALTKVVLSGVVNEVDRAMLVVEPGNAGLGVRQLACPLAQR
jgi:hypothetical protein